MAIIKKKQIQELSPEDAKKRVNELTLELIKAKSNISVGGAPENTGRVREIRKTIARLKTKQNKKEAR